MTYGLGRTVWHDERSRLYPATRSGLRSAKHTLLSDVLDQGSRGSCTGNALAHALNTDKLNGGRRLLDETDAVCIYSIATTIDPYTGQYPVEDTGSSGLAVAKAARKLGLISGYRHAFGWLHTVEALSYTPVIIGVPWLEDMFTPDADGYIVPGGKVVGGHEVCLIEVDVDREDVVVQNSWGSGWGDNGTARLRWSDLDLLLSEGGDATVVHL